MLVEPGEEVLLLPATTRYEDPGGITETSTERRVIFSPEIPGPRIEHARAEWDVFGDLAARVRPELADRVRFAGTPEIRREIGAVIPRYRGIEELTAKGDSFQYGGPMLCEGWEFDTDDGKAHFAVPQIPEPVAADGRFNLATRRGKQFNSMVQDADDLITGAEREAVMISAADAKRLGIDSGDRVLLRSDVGELEGTALVAPIAAGNLEVHWPEGNVLIAGGRRSPDAKIPDYNARVSLEPLSATRPGSPAPPAARSDRSG